MDELKYFGSGVKFHHVGLVVPSIDGVIGAGRKTVDDIQKVAVAFVDLHGMSIELVEPQSESSPVSNSLKKGIKLLHLCYEVQDLQGALEQAKKSNFSLLAQPVPAEAFDGRNIAWVFHKTFGLVELLEGPAR